MKKLLFSLALMLVAGVTSTWAQFDDGEYLIKNVATGQYLQGDYFAGTHAVTKGVQYLVTLTKVSDGVYTIKSQQPNGAETAQYFGTGADVYVDFTATNLTIAASGDYYTISNETGKFYVEPTSGVDGTTVNVVKAGDVTTDYAKWQIISKASIVYDIANATVNNTKTTPKDATLYIKDAGFDVNNGNFSSWTLTSDGGDYYVVGGGNAGHNYQCWNSNSFDMSQTLSGIANGKYKVSCYGYYRYNTETGENNNTQAIAAHNAGTEVLNAKLYAGSQYVDIKSVASYEGSSETLPFSAADCNWQYQAAANFNAGYFLNEVSDVKVTNGTLKFGVKKDARSGIDWTVFDDFKLYYTPDYSNLATLVTSVEAGSNETAKAYVSAIDFTNKKDDLTQGQIDAYYNALTAIVNGTKDYTSAIVNPSFEAGVSDLGTPAGWTVAGNPATANTNADKYGAQNGAFNGQTGTYCYYTGWNGRNVSQSIYLPKGVYKLTADANSWGASVILFGNDVFGTNTTCSGSNTLSVIFEVTDASKPVKIGIAGTNGATSPYAEGGSWGYFVDNFTLTLITAPEYSLPSDALEPTTISAGLTKDATAKSINGSDTQKNVKWNFTTDFCLTSESTATINTSPRGSSVTGTHFELSESAIKYYVGQTATSVTGTLTAGKWYRFTLTSNLKNVLSGDQTNNTMIMTITDLSDNSVVATATPSFRNSSEGIKYGGVVSTTGAIFYNAYSYFTENLVNNGTFDTNIAGWSTAGTLSDNTGSGFYIWTNATDGSFAQMYADGTQSIKYNNDCYISQTISNLAAGYYEVSANLVANGGNQATFSVSDGTNTLVTVTKDREEWATETYTVKLAADGALTIKYVPQANGSAWVAIDNVSLKQVAAPAETVTTNAAGVTSYVTTNALDFSDVEGLTAYICPSFTSTTVNLTKATKVPAGTALVVRGAANTAYSVPGLVSADAVVNQFQAADGSKKASEINTYVYCLNTAGQFQQVGDDVVIPSGKAYLASSEQLAKTLSLNFGDEATAINTVDANVNANKAEGKFVKNGKLVIVKNGKQYNAAGQLVK